MTEAKGTGLRFSVDMRDAGYLMTGPLRALEGSLRADRYWDRGDTLDQGEEGACVGFAWTGWYNSKPMGFYAPKGEEYARKAYHQAQLIDEWDDTPPEEGTSVRAGARVMLAWQTLDEYLWARTADEIRAWIKAFGPVVIGCRWMRYMTETDKDGYIRPTGGLYGGHAVYLYGVNRSDDVLGANSWGNDWGDEGAFKITKPDLDHLISLGGFVACTSRQTGRSA